MAEQKLKYGCMTLILGFIAASALPVQGYEQNKCYCWDEMDSTLKDELITKSVQKQEYKYTGIKYLAEGVYQACVCSDVTRLSSVWKSKSEWVFDFIEANDTNIPVLERNMTETLQELFEVTSPVSPFRDVTLVFVNATTSPETDWTIEVVMKGRDTNLIAQLESALVNLTVADEGSMSFSVLKCAGQPPVASLNGVRTWTSTTILPGDKAVYSCNPGYYIEDQEKAYSECLHTNLSWSSPMSDISCKKGCQGQHPTPFFSSNNWNISRRGEGVVLTYTCMNKFKSITGKNGSSTCQNSEWTPLDTTFKCEMIVCTRDIPQPPPQGRKTWSGRLLIGTVIEYYCMEGYSSPVKGKILSECNDVGEWTPYPEKFECVNNEFAIREGFYDDQMVQPFDYYEDSGITKEKTDESWFWLVTIPSMAAVLLIVLCCFCCTRTDSPIFVLCNKNSKYKYYQTA